MFEHYQNTSLNKLRQQEKMNEAEQERLALEANDPKPFYAPLLNTVGQGLIQLGSSLQERYGEAESVHPSASLASVNK